MRGRGRSTSMMLPMRRVRAVRHHHHAVGEQDRFVDVVGDADGRDLGARPDLHQHVLQLPAGEAVEHAEGLVEQQQLGREGEGAGDADALLHAVGELGGAPVHGVAEADAAADSIRRCRAARPGLALG